MSPSTLPTIHVWKKTHGISDLFIEGTGVRFLSQFIKMLKKSTLSQQTGAIYVQEQEAQQYIERSRCKLLPCIFAV